MGFLVGISTGRKTLVLLDSTVAALADGATYTSAAYDVVGLKEIRVSAFANLASASNGLVVEQSSDSTNYDVESTTTYAGSDKFGFEVSVIGEQARTKFTNVTGSGAQTTFRLYTWGIY